MTKQPSNAPADLTEPIHPVEDQNNSLNYCQFDYPKTTYPQEGSLEEDSPEEEDFQAEEYLEEVEDILEEEEAHLEWDPLEEDGDLHPSKYCNHNQESW